MTHPKAQSKVAHLNLGQWSWSQEDGAPVIIGDFSHLARVENEKLEETSYAIAGRNLAHTKLFHYKEIATSPHGEVYRRNDIESDDENRRIKVIGSENCTILLRWSYKHNPALNAAIMEAAAKWAKSKEKRYKHHKDYGNWSAQLMYDGTPVLIADFSHCAAQGNHGGIRNDHYWGAKANLVNSGLMKEAGQVAEKGADHNNVIYNPPQFGSPLGDDPEWQIRIEGRRNCRVFSNWIRRDDPALHKVFVDQGIQSLLSEVLGELRPSHAATVRRKKPAPGQGFLFDLQNPPPDSPESLSTGQREGRS